MSITALVFALVVAASTLLGAAVGGYLALLGIRRQQFLTDFQREHRDACEQIKAYCQLEELYAHNIARLSGRTPEKVLEDMRSQMDGSDSSRPTWTEHDAQRSINTFGK
jgi:hypothetical protein